MNEDLVNLADFIATELSAVGIPKKKLYQTGNMMSSITPVSVGDNYLEIVIATDYASFTNLRGKWAGWVEQNVARILRCYQTENITDLANYESSVLY